MEQNDQLVPVPLDAGIDNSVSDKGDPKGLRRMVNFDFGAESEIVQRGGFALTTDVNIAPGILVPGRSQASHAFGSHRIPLEASVRAVVGGTGGRTLQVAADTLGGFTLVASLVRAESPTNTEALGINATVQLQVLVAGQATVVGSAVVTGGRMAAIQVTRSGQLDSWLLTWMEDQALKAAVITYNGVTTAITVGTPFTPFAAIPPGWRVCPYAVELDNFGRWTICVWDTLPELKWAKYDGTGTLATSGSTGITNTHYHEIASAVVDGLLYVVSGHATAGRIGVYVAPIDTMVFVTRTFICKGSSVRTFARFAVVPSRFDDEAIVVYEEFGGDCDGVAVFRATAAACFPSTAASLEVLNGVMLADAGMSYFDNGSDLSGERRVGAVGLAPQRAPYGGQRAHVLCAVVEQSGSGSNNTLSAVAMLAGDDAGPYGPAAGSDATDNIGCVEKLPRWSGTELPVPIITRSTQDPTVPLNTELDIFDRAARLTTVTARAWQHRGRAQLGRDLYIGGSFPFVWDGRDLHPAGFLSHHGGLLITQTANGAALPAGTYIYAARTTYQNINGTLFDSPIQFYRRDGLALTTTASGDTPVVQVLPGSIWTESFFANREDRFRTDIFRNASPAEDGDNLYRLAFSDTHDQADIGFDHTDTLPAARVAVGELLPDSNNGAITGNLLPPLRHLCAHRSRLFGVDAFTPTVIHFTTDYRAPTAPRWFGRLSISNSGGEVRAVASLGDKLIAFQANQISMTSGEGPDGTGRGEFAMPESLRGVGCKADHQGSVVEVPTGVMFVADSGIHHLGYDLSLTHVGEKLTGRAQDTELPPFRRAAYLESLKQVWFITDGSDAALGPVDIVIWDTGAQRWSTYKSGYGPFTDVIEAHGIVYLLDEQGRTVRVTDGASWEDVDLTDSSSIPIEFELELGRTRANHAQQIRLRRVHVAGLQDTAASPVNVELVAQTYSESHGLGAESSERTYTTSLAAYGERFQIPARMSTPRCHEVGCILRLTADGVPSGGVRLSNLTYEVSLMPGSGKVALTKKPTVS